jgi:long-chain fatty acid transport protein
MKRKIISILLLHILIGSLSAGGFELYEFGAAASGMSGAVVARSWDASTVFYNPAGIAFLPDGSHLYGNLTLIAATSKWTGAEPVFLNAEYSSVKNLHTPFGLFYSQQFSHSIYAGIGISNPFGLGLEWTEDFPGRSISYNSDLKSFYISPVFAYKISDELSLSAGVDIVFGHVKLQRYVRMFESEGSPGTETAKSTIVGNSDVAYGFTASVMYNTDDLGLGFLYRHSVENKLSDADATFTYLDTYALPIAKQNLVNQKVQSSITFPNFFSIGIYYKFLEKLGAEIDFFWYQWSVFDELVFDFDELGTMVMPENYEDSIQIRLGAHYDLAEAWQLRAGYIYDQTPQPIESVSPLLPDNDRHDFSVGLGYSYSNFNLDIGYMMVDLGQRSTVVDGEGKNTDNFNGTYSSIANLFFFGIGYHLE